MPNLSRTIDYGDGFTASMDNWWPNLVDQVHEANPFWEDMNKRGKTRESGGNVVVTPILRSENTTVDSYAPGEDVNTDQNDIMTIVTQDRRYIAGSIQTTPEEESVNSGDEKMIDLIDARLENLEVSMKRFASRALWQFSAGNGGRSPDPLPLAIISNPTAATPFMGLDPSAEPVWRNEQLDSSATSWAGLKQEFQRIVGLIQRHEMGDPDFAVCDWTTWHIINSAFSSLVRIPDKDDVRYGFKHKGVYIGSTMLYPDNLVPDSQNQLLYNQSPSTGSLYVMSTDYIRLEYGRGLNMKRMPWVWSQKKTGRAMKVLLSVNLIATARRMLGVLENISQTIAA